MWWPRDYHRDPLGISHAFGGTLPARQPGRYRPRHLLEFWHKPSLDLGERVMTHFIAELSLVNSIAGILIPITLAISILLILQSTHTLYLMIYTWDQKEVNRKTQIPARFLDRKSVV